MRRIMVLAAIAAALPLGARTQTEPGGYLSFRSSQPGVRIAIDTLEARSAPFDSLPVPSGAVVLRVLPARPSAWSEPFAVETLLVRPGEHIVRDGAAYGARRVSSEPYGAKVYARDSLLGTTPLVLPSRMEGQMLRLTRDGFEEALAPFAGDLHVALLPRAGTARPYLAAEPSRSMTPVYTAAGASVLAGAAAAYCKIKADARYADYRRSGSGADLDEVRKLDRLSGISLALSELALFVLTYQLFSR